MWRSVNNKRGGSMSLELRRGLMVAVGIPKDAIIVAERSDNEAALMNVIYAQGWSASPKYMRKSEAEKVTDIGTAFKSNTAITDFSAFEYFTSVTELKQNCFQYTSALRKILLPISLTKIESYAFMSSGLTSIYLPKYIISIGPESFRNCVSLEKVQFDIECKLSYIADLVFYACSKLKEVILSPYILTISRRTFELCSKLEKINLDKVITIGDMVFANNSNASLYIDTMTSVKSIGKSAFSLCKLVHISIPDTCHTIASKAFQNNYATNSIRIGSAVNNMSPDSFDDVGRDELESIKVSEENPTYDSRNGCNAIIETGTNTLIKGCKNTSIPDGVEIIRAGAFYYLSRSKTIFDFPSTLVKFTGNPFPYTNVYTLIFRSQTPPTGTFSSSAISSIFVPDDSIELYKSATNFANYIDKIKPLSEYETNL